MCQDGSCIQQENCGNGSCDAGEQFETCPEDCECVPDCGDKECGDDGCGGSCSPGCEEAEVCQDGDCIQVIEGDTWTDPSTGLVWQVEPTGGFMSWVDAKEHCSGLPLAGSGWHLPTIGELRTLLRGCPGTESGGACGVTDDCLSSFSCQNGDCDGCGEGNGPATGGYYWPEEMKGYPVGHWSSSEAEDQDNMAWFINFNYAHILYFPYTGLPMIARCVR